MILPETGKTVAVRTDKADYSMADVTGVSAKVLTLTYRTYNPETKRMTRTTDDVPVHNIRRWSYVL